MALNGSRDKLYIISARGSSLVIYDIPEDFGSNNSQKVAELRTIVFLDAKMIPQPEGITFDSDNNLYISSEGKTGKGTIAKFAPLR